MNQNTNKIFLVKIYLYFWAYESKGYKLKSGQEMYLISQGLF